MSTVLELVREHLSAGIGTEGQPTVSATPGLAAIAAALRAGEPKHADRLLAESSSRDVDEATQRALHQLITYHERVWFPGGFGTADDPDPAVLPLIYADLAGSAVPPQLRLAVELATCAGAWRFMVIGSSRVGAQQGQAAAIRLLDDLRSWLQRTTDSGAGALAAQGALVAADLMRLGGVGDQMAEFLDAANAANATNAANADVADVAWAGSGEPGRLAAHGAGQLVRADAVLTPWSSPELLGLDPWELSRAPTPIERIEVAEAQQAFTVADDCFQRAAAPRGRAAVALRRGYLAALRGDPAGAAEHAFRAEKFAAEAGDRAYEHLARIHRLIALIRSGRPGELRTTAPALAARWARTDGSPSYVRGLVRIMRGAARHWWQHGAVEEARSLLTAATDLVVGLGAADERLACLGDASELYAALNSRGPAIGTLHRVLTAHLAEHGGWRAEQPLDLIVWQQAGALLFALTNQYMEERDANGQAWCAERAGWLSKRRPNSPPPPQLTEDIFAATRRRYDRLPELGQLRTVLSDHPPTDRLAQEMEAACAASLLAGTAQATVFVPLARALRWRRTGFDADADREFDTALQAARALAEAGRSLQVLALTTARRYAEAAEVIRQLLQATPDFPADLHIGLLILAQEHREATRVVRDAELTWNSMADIPIGRRWKNVLNECEIALRTGDIPRARELASAGQQDFEQWFAALSRDPFRLSVTDDVAARRLYFLAAEAALADHDVTRSILLGDRLRALPMLALLDDRAHSDPGQDAAALQHWQRANARWSAAYDLMAAAAPQTIADPAAAPVPPVPAMVAELAASIEDPAFDLLDRAGFSRASGYSRQQAAQLFMDAEQLELERAEGRISGRNLPVPPLAPEFDELRAGLPADCLLLQYLLTGDRLLIWALGADVCHGVVRTVDVDRISGDVRRIHSACAGAAYAGDPERSRQLLGELLIEPMAHVIDGHSRLIIVPSEPLHLLPFTVLPAGEDVLAARHVVSMLPAAALLPRLTGRRDATAGVPAAADATARATALVVGDPYFAPSTHLRKLPGTRAEAIRVASYYGTQALLGDVASAAAVSERLPTADVVHLATHGLISEIAPTASAIALTGTDRLTVADLAGLHLNAELVVLSACDTGRGDATLGGDVVGLSRQLIAAGARRAIVSLWPVEDETTCLLMDDLHRRLATGTDAAHALAAAQRWLRALPGHERHARYAQLDPLGRPDATTDSRPGASARRSAQPDLWPSQADPGEILRDATWWAPFVLIGGP